MKLWEPVVKIIFYELNFALNRYKTRAVSMSDTGINNSLLPTRVLTSYRIKTVVFGLILICDVTFGLVYSVSTKTGFEIREKIPHPPTSILAAVSSSPVDEYLVHRSVFLLLHQIFSHLLQLECDRLLLSRHTLSTVPASCLASSILAVQVRVEATVLVSSGRQ